MKIRLKSLIVSWLTISILLIGVTYVHSSVAWVRDERIPSGRMTTYNASLDIQPDPPSYGSEGRVSWSLVTTVDVVRARDMKVRRPVNVALA